MGLGEKDRVEVLPPLPGGIGFMSRRAGETSKCSGVRTTGRATPAALCAESFLADDLA
jgi:hypothetical protein